MTNSQKILIGLTYLFRGFTEEQALMYDRYLRDIPPELLAKAIDKVVMTSKYTPTVAEIREAANSLYSTASGIEPPDASRAWGEVLKAIGRVGMYRKPKFDDSVTAETVKRMGWKELCLQGVDTISVARAQFMKIYSSISESGRTRKRNERLIAGTNIKNLVAGIAGRKLIADRNS